MMIIWDLSLLVQLILELLWELLFTSIYLIYLKKKMSFKQLLTNIMYKFEEHMENILKLMMEYLIFQILED